MGSASPELQKTIRYLAHSPNDEGAGVPETLHDHLRAVADRAAGFAAAFGAQEQAHAAGLLHDLGKYADQFQRRLSDPHEPGRDHWTAGAVSFASTGRRLGVAPAIAVCGHHAGLPAVPADGHAWFKAIADRVLGDRGKPPRDRVFTETDLSLLHHRYLTDGLPRPAIRDGLCLGDGLAADMLDVRMLFSALVDADYLETEAHFNGDAQTPRRPRPNGPRLDCNKAIAALEKHIGNLRERFRGAPMAAARESLYARCVAASALPPGLFSLSAPTGSAKTLAMLAFALHHARRHGLRRIVLVMPYLNIIEQTASLYRQVFSPDQGFDPDTILEHHSLARDGGEPRTYDEAGDADLRRRHLVENWDAPVLLTTTAQLLESLMADRPARCRKLHRLAQSVLLFDEVQTLPLRLAVATLATLSRLAGPAGPFRSTIVFATATQPAFDVLDGRVRREFAAAGWQPREIVEDAGPLYATAAQRVQVTWRHTEPIDLDELATELDSHDRVLCIVNLKRHAVRLAATLRNRGTEGLVHLSTNMCPAHRAEVLAKVNRRLEKGHKVRLVATQCVEAGVDLDFPAVYRALAPLEAIAQAAGRCNRHGLGPRGEVVVFKPHDGQLYPPGYGEAADATQTFLASSSTRSALDATEVLNSPERLRAYFRHFYGLSGRDSSERDDERPLLDAIRAGDFAAVARLYRLIKQDTINVLVPYDPRAFEQLRREIRETEPLTPEFIRRWCHRASPYAVGLFRPRANAPITPHLEPIQFSRRRRVEDVEADWFLALPGVDYDPLLGISERSEDVWIA